MIKVQGEPDLVRDPYSKAILNTNVIALNEHRKRKELARVASKKMDMLEAKVESLEQSLSEIKSMLGVLVDQQKDKNK
jgi:hypothetical protein